jgi:hypothetical protein
MKTITRFFAIVAISLASVSAFAQPTVAPTAPSTRPASSVISIYGTNSYTPITGVNTFPDWGQFGQGSTAATYNIAGPNHNVLKYGKLSYQGIDFTGNVQDVSGMKKLHLDIWTADAAATPLSIAIINGNTNIAVSKTITTTGTWNSLDIVLTEFTGQNLTAINQLMFKSAEWSTFATNLLQKDIYVDNIYFWTDVVPSLTVSATSIAIAQPANSSGNFAVTATQNWNAASDQTWLTVSPTNGTSAGATVTLTATANTSTASRTATVTVTGTDATVKTVTVTQAGLPIPASPTPTVAGANVKSIYSDAYTASVTNFDYLGQQWWNSTWSAVTLAGGGNALKLVATTAGGGGGGVQFAALTITGMTNLHFDIYPAPDAVGATMKYTVTPAGAWIVLPTPSNYSTLTANAWNSFDIPVSTLASGASTLPTQVGFGTFSGPGTFYIDNIVFYNGTYTISTGISSVIADNGIKCYPSIAKNSLNVSADNEISEISIVSLVGQSLRTVTVNSNSKTITLNDLVSGQYLVRIKLANGQIGTQKFVKL